MTIELIGHWLHLVSAILLVGNALFWVVMTIGVRRSADPTEAARLLGVINAGRWPHVAVPRALRLPFPALAWAFLVVLGLTGLLLLQADQGALFGSSTSEIAAHPRFDGLMRTKLALFGLLVLGQVQVTLEPRRWLAFVNGGLVLAIVAVSALLER
jgi:hypothetical protein